jgi:hypothetical protein
MAGAPEIIGKPKGTSRSHLPADSGSPEMIKKLDQIDAEGKSANDKIGRKRDRWLRIWRGESNSGPGPQRPDPMFSADILTSAIERKISLLSEGQPILDIQPRRYGLDATGLILKAATKGVWDQQQFPIALELLLTYAGIFGCGGFRTRWEPTAGYGFGEITLSAWDPRNLCVDPAVVNAADLSLGQYVRLDSVVPTGMLRRKYPDRGGELTGDTRVKPSEPDTKNNSGIWNMRNIFRGASDKVKDAVPRSSLREYFLFDPATDNEGLPKYPNGRYLLRAEDDVVLNDGEGEDQNPYFDGLCDVDLFDNHPDPDHPLGRSEIEALQFLGNAFNRSGNLLLKSFIRNAYPWVVADRGALDADTIQMLKDADQMVLEKGGGREVTRTAGPLLDQALPLMQFIEQVIFQMSGLTDPGMEGKGRVELRSGAQVEGLQSAAQLIVRAQARRLEELLERVGQKIISRIFQFYDDDRMLTYYGGGMEFVKYRFERQKLVSEIIALGVKRALEDAKKDDADLDEPTLADAILFSIKGAWRDFQFKIVPYSSLSTTRQQRAALKGALVQQHILSPDEVLREAGYENPREKMEEAADTFKWMEQVGLTPPPDEKGKKKK